MIRPVVPKGMPAMVHPCKEVAVTFANDDVNVGPPRHETTPACAQVAMTGCPGSLRGMNTP